MTVETTENRTLAAFSDLSTKLALIGDHGLVKPGS